DDFVGCDDAFGAGAETNRTRYDLNRNRTLGAMLVEASTLFENHEQNIQGVIFYQAHRLPVPGGPFGSTFEPCNFSRNIDRDHSADGGTKGLSVMFCAHSTTPMRWDYISAPVDCYLPQGCQRSVRG